MNEQSQKKAELLAVSDDDDRPKDDTIAELEKRVQGLENKLYEERFIWVLVAVILIDFLLFPDMESWSAPIVIGILQFIGLFVLAERCKVDAILPLIDRIGGAVKNFRKDEN